MYMAAIMVMDKGGQVLEMLLKPYFNHLSNGNDNDCFGHWFD